MSKFFYSRLALANIKKNSKTYTPYLISCICSVMMYYIILALSGNEGIYKIRGGASLAVMMELGEYVVGIFCTILLFYTNSFLIKRRKKEIAIYNILGMEKKHIAKMLSWETAFSAVISLFFGILGGVILSKLIFLLLLKLVGFTVPFGANFSLSASINTMILFTAILIASLAYNLFQIHLANPIELLQGGKSGEKEPKANWIIALAGVITLGIGYGMALSVESPLQAISIFFIAVIFVIVGTYLIFTAGSIALLKIMRKNKRFYYKTINFTSVSGMIYRMKQNAVGLASICLLSTAVLVMISSTLSLYMGMNDILDERFERDCYIQSYEIDENKIQNITEILSYQGGKHSVTYENMSAFEGLRFFADTGDAQGKNTPEDMLYAISLEEYNRLAKENVQLKDNEVLLYQKKSPFQSDKIVLGSTEYTVKELAEFPIDAVESNIGREYDHLIYLVMGNEKEVIDLVNNNYLDNNNQRQPYKTMIYYSSFDLNGSEANKISLGIDIRAETMALGKTYVESRHEMVESFYADFGGMLFIGIFIGILFLGATTIIIYYKQISEGYSDRERFEIMQNVGMSKHEVKQTIRSQIVKVFFMPLAMAIIHIAFAFPIITKLLALFQMYNVTLFAQCTIGTIIVFVVIYTVVYALTARTYYKIVS